MQRTTTRLGAVAATAALAIAGSATAAQALTVPPVSPLLGDAQQLLHDSGRTAGDVTNTASATVQEAGIVAFAVVGHAGRLVGGENVVGIRTSATGDWRITYSVDLRGCATVAMDNSVTDRVLSARSMSARSVRVAGRNVATSLRGSGFTVAVVC